MATKMRRLSFWENYYLPMKRIKDRQKRAEYALKVLEYAFDDIEPELDEVEGMAFDSIASLIYDDMHGNKGGRPTGNASSSVSSPKTKPKTHAKTSLETSFETSEQTVPYEKKGREGNGIEEENNFSLRKSYLSSPSSGDAAVAGATPPSAGLPHCPECDDLMAFDPRGGFWRCRNHECRATLKPAAVDKGTPHCPLCHSVAHEDEGKWICPICGEIKAPDFGGAK